MDFYAQFKEEFMTILTDGGILMLPLGLLAIAIYAIAFRLFYYFVEHSFYKIKREKLIEYLMNPIMATGELRQIIDYTQDPEIESKDELASRFAEISNAYLAHIDAACVPADLVTIAPLMGLLGTVMGMLTTFSGLAVSVGGKTVDQIAAGISEALITTQTGLIIAIPGYVMASMILKRRDQMEAFLNSVQAITTQLFEKKSKLPSDL
ncbi:MAG: MotA/TolQ/ExbB proton channel family protein [Verrucomicrobia bacterium]|nr:MotA/TolQ/ExbB proton channel family protein [Verrucomicrobiota bacterium]